MIKRNLLIGFTIINTQIFAMEICSNGIDDDGDGLVDFNDPDCSCLGPNLVPNPSFENYSSCPDDRSGPGPGQDQFERIDSWSNTYPSIGPKMTPDVYNSCSPGPNGVPWTNGVSITNPLAADGEGYAGLVTYITNYGTTGQFREYITARLNTTLQARRRYIVNFKWRIHTGNWVVYTNRFGMHFSNSVPNTYYSNQEAPSVLNVTPQIELPSTAFLDKTSQWVDFSQDFVASGGENYITLGNFYRDIETTIHDINANALGYIFVDDISIQEVLIPESITVAPDVTINPGDNTTLSVNASGGIPTYAWSATPADSTLNGQETSQNPTVAPLENTIYTVTADFNGCILQEQMLVNVNTPCPTVVATVTPPAIVINEGSVQLNTTPTANAYYHTWSGPAASDLNLTNRPNPVFTPTSTGTFVFTVETNFNGQCTNSADVTVVVTSLPTLVCGDNLVPNPSFENLSGCPRNVSVEVSDAQNYEHYSEFVEDWTNVSGSTTDTSSSGVNSTPDVFNSCCNNCPVDVPRTLLGNIVNPLAPDGGGYAGLVLLSSFNNPDYREYIAARLDETLEVGATYVVELKFRVQNTNGTVFTNRFGAHFSQGIPSNFRNTTADSPGILDVVPQVEHPSNQFLDVTNQWVQFSQTFVANTAADHIVLGSFYDDSETATSNSSDNFIKLLVDEVSVRKSTSSDTVDAGPDVTIKSGDSTTLTATPSNGSPTYTWTASPADTSLSGQESSQNPMVAPTQTTVYTVTADFGGCADSDTVTVTVNPCALVLDDSNVTVSNATCGGGYGTISGIIVNGANGNETYQWIAENGEIIDNNIDLIGEGPGSYLLTVEQGACSISSGPYTLLENGAPILYDDTVNIIMANCDSDDGAINGISIIGNSGSESYTWTNQNGTIVGSSLNLTEVSAGTYTLTVVDKGCNTVAGPYDVDELNNCLESEKDSIRVASAMTANGDGSNDMFMITGLENYPNIYKTATLISLLIFSINSDAQQNPQFSQYLQNPLVLNPAISGVEDFLDLTLSYRNQWTGFEGAPRTATLSFYTPVNFLTNSRRFDSFSGIGTFIYRDDTGPINQSGYYLSYAYHLKASEEWFVSLGTFIGGSQFSFNSEDVTLIENPNDILVQDIASTNFDMSFGLYIYSKYMFAGVATHQVFDQDILYNVQNNILTSGKQNRNYNLLIGSRIVLDRDWNIIPSLVMRTLENAPLQWDISAKAEFQNRVWGGVSYRNEESIYVLAGFKIWDSFLVGYSYDYPISQLRNNQSGSHEILPSYRIFGTKNKCGCAVNSL